MRTRTHTLQDSSDFHKKQTNFHAHIFCNEAEKSSYHIFVITGIVIRKQFEPFCLLLLHTFFGFLRVKLIESCRWWWRNWWLAYWRCRNYLL